jgi:hypothetical protein
MHAERVLCVTINGMRWFAALLLVAPLSAQLTVRVIEQGPDIPIEGAKVELRLAGGLGPASRLNRQYPDCQTNASGECQYGNLIRGNYSVLISRPGFVDADDLQARVVGASVLIQTLREINIEVRMVRTGTVHGAVYSEDGKPVVLAPLKLRLMDPAEPRRRPFSILLRTDENGVFMAGDVPPGKYGLWISTTERLRAQSRITDPASGEAIGYPAMVYHTGVEEEHWVEPVEVWPGAELRNRVVVVRKMRVYRIRGQLIDSVTKAPLTNARVALRTGDGAYEEVYSQRMVHPRTGVFSFSLLAPADYQLLVYRPAPDPSPPWTVPVTVERGRGASDLALEVPQWTDIAGAIVPRSAWIVNATRIAIEPESSADETVPAAMDREGRFQLRRLPPGRYTLRVQTQEGCYASEAFIGGIDALESGFLLPASNSMAMNLRIECEASSVKGEVVEGLDKKVTRAYVVLGPESTRRIRRLGAVRMNRTGPDGEFFFDNLPPGAYRLVALKSRPKVSPETEEFWRQYGPGAARIEVDARHSPTLSLQLTQQPAN